jgi:hypothetical protein
MATMMLAVAAAGAYCWMLRETVGLAEAAGWPIGGAGREGLIAVAGLVASWTPVEIGGRLRRESLATSLVHFAAACCLFAVLKVWVIVGSVLLAGFAVLFHVSAAIDLVRQGPEGRAVLRKARRDLGSVLIEVIGLDLVYLLILESNYYAP